MVRGLFVRFPWGWEELLSLICFGGGNPTPTSMGDIACVLEGMLPIRYLQIFLTPASAIGSDSSMSRDFFFSRGSHYVCMYAVSEWDEKDMY